MNQITKVIIPTILVSSVAFVLFQIKNTPVNSSNSSPDKPNNSDKNQNQTDQNTSEIKYTKLSVLKNRCLGCGKCVRIDPQHFEMSGRQATVVSSTNLNSSNLALAINNCPAQAITLE